MVQYETATRDNNASELRFKAKYPRASQQSDLNFPALLRGYIVGNDMCHSLNGVLVQALYLHSKIVALLSPREGNAYDESVKKEERCDKHRKV